MFGLERWMLTTMAAALVAIGLYGGGFWHGWSMASDKWKTEKAQIIADSEIRAKMLEQKGLSLAADLEKARAQVKVQTVEVVREVVKYASSKRECFSPDVTAILNKNTPIRETRTPIVEPGQPTQKPTVIDHKVQGPVGGTSEQAAATWVAEAQASHEQCRSQVHGLIAWVKSASASGAK